MSEIMVGACSELADGDHRIVAIGELEVGIFRLGVPHRPEDLGGNADRRAGTGRDHLVAELELERARDHEVDLLLLGVPVTVGALPAGVLGHPAVGEGCAPPARAR